MTDICAACNAGACGTADALGRKTSCDCCREHDVRDLSQTSTEVDDLPADRATSTTAQEKSC